MRKNNYAAILIILSYCRDLCWSFAKCLAFQSENTRK